MAAFDVAAALRWSRFDEGSTIPRRVDSALPFASADRLAGSPLLLDTCVYIDQMQSRAPDIVSALVHARLTNHSTVVIQELMHTVGVLDPNDPRTAAIVGVIRRQIEAMPAHRLAAPDADVLGRAGLLSGILCRLQGYAKDARLRALLDCTLFLQARKQGLTVLTANLVDFDILLQLVPTGRVLFYRRI